jgi:hypothetical protein
MTLVGLVAIVLSFVGLYFASARNSNQRTPLALLLIALQIAASFAFYLYAQTTWADSYGYYYDPGRMASWDFEFGTVFLVKTVAALKTVIGGTYLDYFLLFQMFGAWGIILMFRTFQEVHLQLGQRPSDMSYAVLLLPGLHFWTSAPGKDAPILLAVSFAVWSIMRLSSRFLALAIALCIMVFVRPHIALITIVALALATAFERRSNGLARAGLITSAFVGAGYLAMTVKRTIKLDVSSASSISDWFTMRGDISQTVAGGSNIGEASFPVRLFSLLFQPLFVDANGLMGLVASFENIFLLFMFGFIALRHKGMLLLIRRVFFARFVFIFALTLIVLLSMLQYNVGLGLRQKVMIYPAFFSFFVALWAFNREDRRVAAERRLSFVHPATADLAPAEVSAPE